MKSLLLLPLFVASLATAQTEVHRGPINLPSYKELKFPPLPALQIPKPVEFTLSNGIKVFLLEDHELPLVSGGALIRTGNLFDPADKHGVAQLTGEVLRSGGTKAKTGDQIDEDLENVAASVESQIGEGSGSLSFNCLKENTDQVLEVFKDFLTHAEFREDKVDLAKTQLRSEISRRNDDAGGIAEREFANILYGRNTPYGWQIEYADVDRIHRQDLVDFYHRYYFPANIILEVYGDFSASDMQAKLEQLLGGWKYAQSPVPAFPKVEAKPEPGVFLAAKTDVTQTFFNIGELGGEYRDKDYPALEVAAQILGGGFSSRLLRRIRTELGWAYNIGASWDANYDHPGVFRISGSTQSMHTVDTLKTVREELEKFRSAEVSDEELKTAKDTVLNGFVFHFDRPSKTLNRLVLYEYFGYPRDFLFQYQKAIAAVSKADILRVAQKYFKVSDLTYVAAGNPKDFGTPLSALGLPVQDIDLTIPEPKQEAAQVDPASLEKGKELLQHLQQALGGADKLAAVKDLVYHGEAGIETPGATMKVKQTNSYLAPSSLRQDLELPFAKQSVYSDGAGGWLSTPQGMMGMTPAVLKQIRGEVFRQIPPLAMSDRDADRTVSYVAEGAIEISVKDGESVRLEVDPKTGFPLKIIYESGQGLVEQTYSDWRDVNGMRLPFGWTIMQGGKKFASVTVTDYKVNSGLTKEEISKKP
ncbi:MAG TPA: insulinase family protein [Bryobacteraceae bacterium]|jgi:zinc protease|nr:insulinase family protein [Bryobacteraceae bacterium]